jgi:hypothetical protein
LRRALTKHRHPRHCGREAGPDERPRSGHFALRAGVFDLSATAGKRLAWLRKGNGILKISGSAVTEKGGDFHFASPAHS